MKLLIIGATGGTGRELVAQALAAGHEVTALVRNPGKVAARHERLRLEQGDILDSSSADSAVSGQDAVLSSLGTKSIFARVVIFSEGTKNLLNAMTNHGVRRLICITRIGAGDSRGHWGVLLRQVRPAPFSEEDLRRQGQEDLIRKSDREWIIVRPGFLTNGRAAGSCRVLTHLTGVMVGRISRADVAAFMLGELQNDRYLRQTLVLTY